MLNNLLAQATTVNLNVSGQFGNATKITPNSLIRAAVIGILAVAALVFFIMLLVGGLKYILSGGDKGKTESARGQITAALIGLVIVFAAWAILQLMSTFIGVDFTNFTIPTAYN